MVKFDEKGREVLSQEPVAVPVNRTRKVGEIERMRNTVFQMQREAEHLAEESLEDERDFDMDEDKFPESVHEQFKESEKYDLLVSDIQEFAEKKKAEKAQEEEATPDSRKSGGGRKKPPKPPVAAEDQEPDED